MIFIHLFLFNVTTHIKVDYKIKEWSRCSFITFYLLGDRGLRWFQRIDPLHIKITYRGLDQMKNMCSGPCLTHTFGVWLQIKNISSDQINGRCSMHIKEPPRQLIVSLASPYSLPPNPRACLQFSTIIIININQGIKRITRSYESEKIYAQVDGVKVVEHMVNYIGTQQ